MKAIVAFTGDLYGPLSPKKKKKQKKRDKSPEFKKPSIFQLKDLSQALWNMNVQDMLPCVPTLGLDDGTPSYVQAQMGGSPSDPDVLRLYDETFRPLPGDVLIYHTKCKLPFTDQDTMVAIFNDPLYFWKATNSDIKFYNRSLRLTDPDAEKRQSREFRQNILDQHHLRAGDVLVRFGKFSRRRSWCLNKRISFYLYWPGLNPPEDSSISVMHPWYKLTTEIPQLDGFGAQTPAWPSFTMSPYAPVPMSVPGFAVKVGDLIIRFVRPTSSKVPPFYFNVHAFYWTPAHECVGMDRLIMKGDRLLRFGMNFGPVRDDKSGHKYPTAYAAAELYFKEKDAWLYLGQHQIKVNERYEKHKIKKLSEVPKPGDVVLHRLGEGIWGRPWNPVLKVGGLVSFHRFEDSYDMGESKPYKWHKDAGRYGVGDVTSVLRFGEFQENPGNSLKWKDLHKIYLFVLNTQTSAWRKAAKIAWPVEQDARMRPRPNYNWTQYNPDDVGEVHPDFSPIDGDILVKFIRDVEKIRRFQDARNVGDTYNPHWDVNPVLDMYLNLEQKEQVGDFLVRAGYEQNSANPMWTNATVEVYQLEAREGRECWRFKGRDMYIYGTNFLTGGLAGVERSGIEGLNVDQIPSIDPWLDSQLGDPDRCAMPEMFLGIALGKAFHSCN